MKRETVLIERGEPYALVRDVLAGSEHYAPLATAISEPVPDGLLLHVAGPTLVGFRTIDVWESEDAWLRFERERLNGLFDGLPVAPLVRKLQVHDLVAQPEIEDSVRDIDALQRVITAARLVA